MSTVIVVGSINRDVYLQVPALPLPGQTTIASRVYTGLGGKGANQAVAAARLGAEVAFIGAVGQDDEPDERFTLTSLGVDAAEVQVVPGVSTGTATVVVADSGENQIVVAPGANEHVDLDVLLDSLEVRLRTSAASAGTRPVVVAQGELGARVLDQVIRTVSRLRANLHPAPLLIVNLAPVVAISQLALAEIDVLVVNQGEAAGLLADLGGPQLLQDSSQKAIGRHVAAAFGTTTVMTMGAEGAFLAGARGEPPMMQASAPVEAVVDTTGAGDCLVGVLAAELSRCAPIDEALRWAVTAAAIAVACRGTTSSFPPRRDVAARLPLTPSPTPLTSSICDR